MYVLTPRESSSVKKSQLLKSNNKPNNNMMMMMMMNMPTTTKSRFLQNRVDQQHLSANNNKSQQELLFKKIRSNKKQVFSTSLKKPTRSIHLIVVILALGAIIFSSVVLDVVKCQEQLSIESRQQKDNDDLNDAIKYLEKLDKYFSQMARPRYGRSQFKQPMLRTFGASSNSAFNAGLGGTGTGNSQQVVAPASGGSWLEPTRYNNLMDLAGARLAQRYRDGLAY